MKHFQFDPFINAYSNHITNIILANPVYRPFLVTKTFANPNAYSMKSVAKYLFEQNERIHLHIQSRLTNNYSRKPRLFARSFDFLDISNTKNSFQVNTDMPLKPHIHSIYLIHQETLTAFRNLINENFVSVIAYRMNSPDHEKTEKIRAFPALKTIDARPVAIDQIPETLVYAAKLLKNFSIQIMMTDIDFYDLLPRPEISHYLPRMSARPFPKSA